MRSLYTCALLFTALPALGSTVAIDPIGRGTWVIDQERQEVALISSTGEVKQIKVGAWPEQVVVTADGTAFVSCRRDGRIDVISPNFAVSSIDVGVEPRALVLDREGHNLYAALVTERAVARIDTKYRVVIRKRKVDMEPYTLALTPAGLAVAGSKSDTILFLPPELGSEPAPMVTLLPPDGSKRKPWHIQALAAENNELYVIHANVDTGLAKPSFGGGYGGGVSQPILMAVSVIRADPQPALLGHAGNLDVKDVQGAIVRDRMLYVASRGTKQLVVAAIAGENKVFLSPSEALNIGPGVSGLALNANGTVHTFVAFKRHLAQVTVRRRAREILFDPDHMSLGSNSIAVGVHDQQHPLTVASRSWIGLGTADEELALGRELFHDAVSPKLSGAQTGCVTCHPDGREDGLVWRLGGTRRQTPLLAGRLHGTAPFNWEGTTATLEENIEQTIQRLGGFGISKKEVRALARFILEGLPKPTIAAHHDAALVARGEKVFSDPVVGCASCHAPEAGYADAETWDVESTTAQEIEEVDRVRPLKMMRVGKKVKITAERAPLEYNTPSLKFVALTAPYFHNGSATTLEELITLNNDRMGRTNGLAAEDKRALVAYLSTL